MSSERSPSTGLPITIAAPIPTYAPRPGVELPADVRRAAHGFVAFLVAVLLAAAVVLGSSRRDPQPRPVPTVRDGGVK